MESINILKEKIKALESHIKKQDETIEGWIKVANKKDKILETYKSKGKLVLGWLVDSALQEQAKNEVGIGREAGKPNLFFITIGNAILDSDNNYATVIPDHNPVSLTIARADTLEDARKIANEIELNPNDPDSPSNVMIEDRYTGVIEERQIARRMKVEYSEERYRNLL